jgi:hypothetical protein
MKIELIFFYRHLSGLLHPTTGKFRLVMRKIGVAGQLPRVYYTPGAAVLTLGFVPASRCSHLGHGNTPIVLIQGREIPTDCCLPRETFSGDNQNNSAIVLCFSAKVLWFSLAYFSTFGGKTFTLWWFEPSWNFWIGVWHSNAFGFP